MTHRRAAVVIALTAGLAGCGSSSSSNSSPASYRASVNKICAASNAKVTAMPASSANSAAGLQKLYGIEESAVSQVRAIKPPSSLSSQVQAWLTTIAQAETNANQIVSAVKAGQTGQLRGLAAKAQSLNAQSNSQATALGVTECARNPQPSGKG